MKIRILRNRCVIGLIVLALIAGCFQLKPYWWQPVEVRAQGDDDDDGLSGGALAVLLLDVNQTQKLRLSVGTLERAREYAWSVVVRNQSNAVLFRSERIQVPSGEWRSEEFSGFGQAGGTPVMVQVLVEGTGAGNASQYIGSAQLINVATGESSTYFTFKFETAFITKVECCL